MTPDTTPDPDVGGGATRTRAAARVGARHADDPTLHTDPDCSGLQQATDHMRVDRARYPDADECTICTEGTGTAGVGSETAQKLLDADPDEGTKLKNGNAGERWVYLGPQWFQILDDYVDNPDREAVTDEYRREALFTTEEGTRPSPQSIYKWVMRALHPCSYATCPHDRTPQSCDARGRDCNVAACPSSRSPHAVRRGAITHHLHQDTPPETVSERMDVSLDVLNEHYDARTEREKMDV